MIRKFLIDVDGNRIVVHESERADVGLWFTPDEVRRAKLRHYAYKEVAQ